MYMERNESELLNPNNDQAGIYPNAGLKAIDVKLKPFHKWQWSLSLRLIKKQQISIETHNCQT